jgi:hypothetical protein
MWGEAWPDRTSPSRTARTPDEDRHVLVGQRDGALGGSADLLVVGPHGHLSSSCCEPWSPRQRTACLAASSEAASAAPPHPKRLPPIPACSVPRSLADMLACFQACFTAPTFQTVSALVAGFLARPELRTVTGILTGARLAAH